MSGDTSREITIRIDEKLSRLPDTWMKRSIFRVYGKQRSDNKESYDPQVVSIGPYHRGKPELMKMEEYKLRCLKELLNSRRESSAEKFKIAMAEIEDQARSCYAEETGLSTDDFVEMLCLDGCFVIQFLRKLRQPELLKENDPIFQISWRFSATANDLILFENQLPFFVLHQLFEMTKLPDEENLIDLACNHTQQVLSFPGLDSFSTIFTQSVHLVDLMHKNLSASFSETLPSIEDPRLEYHTGTILPFIKPVSELIQSGVKFKRAENRKSLLHITFENGVLEIPPLVVEDRTESIFRNLIACEQHMSKPIEAWRCITDYITFMDLLIDSPSDVEKLRNSHIIKNMLGHDEAVSTMFNKLTTDVTMGTRFCYAKIFKKVNEYSSKRRNIWRARLMRDYFNTPWSIISFVAAFVLILLTAVQAIFSILQYTST